MSSASVSCTWGSSFEPLGAVDLGEKIGERELGIFGALVLGQAEKWIVLFERLMVVLAGQRRSVAEVVERAARGDIERPVDIDQGAVEIEEDRFEFALR